MKEDKKKKIIYVITKSSWGGATRYVFDLASGLPKDDYETIVAFGGEGLLCDKLRKENIKTISIKNLERDMSILKEVSVFMELVDIFRKEKPDIVHLNSSKAGGLGALAAKISGVPRIIFTAHGWAFNEERPFWQKALIKIFVWVSLLLQDSIICVSEATRNDIKNFPFVYKKSQVIYNGILDFRLLEKNEARIALNNMSRIKLPTDAIWLGTLTELHKNKGLEYAIKAVSSLKEPSIVFAIIGDGELRSRLEDQIEKEELGEKVVLLGFIENAQKYLRAFDIFLLSSVTEAFPYALLEAGYAGLPVIASSAGGIVDVISNDCGILVKPKNEMDIKNKLKYLISNKEAMVKAGVNLKNRIKEKFLFDNMLSQTIKLYL